MAGLGAPAPLQKVRAKGCQGGPGGRSPFQGQAEAEHREKANRPWLNPVEKEAQPQRGDYRGSAETPPTGQPSLLWLSDLSTHPD